MKVIGLLTAWASEDWIVPCVRNAMTYVDELRVCVAYHHPDMADMEDDTEKLVRGLTAGYSNVRVYGGMCNNDYNTMPDVAKCRILNAMLRGHTVGDVAMICDVDEFYDEAGAKEIREFAESDHDMGVVQARYFAVDYKHCVINTDMPRLFRIVPGFSFSPTQRPNPTPKSPHTLQNLMFHYSLFTNPELRRRYWRYSPIGNPAKQKMKQDWFDQIYLKWDLNDEERMMTENERLTGNHGFWLQNDMVEKEGGGLLIYDGPHPLGILQKGM